MKQRVCEFCKLLWRGGLGFQKGDIDAKFCGRACFNRWKQKMDLANCEIEAIQNSLPALGEYVVKSGIVSKPFADCSKEEILGLMANTIKIFRSQLAETLEGDAPF